ncbi:MAG: hypothetical protein BWY76_01638 [bacterium ADurb.Bin429]|nr:MAG: hypothetical protein BWY76_01638 [bacterium ADurb.Bin429]
MDVTNRPRSRFARFWPLWLLLLLFSLGWAGLACWGWWSQHNLPVVTRTALQPYNDLLSYDMLMPEYPRLMRMEDSKMPATWAWLDEECCPLPGKTATGGIVFSPTGKTVMRSNTYIVGGTPHVTVAATHAGGPPLTKLYQHTRSGYYRGGGQPRFLSDTVFLRDDEIRTVDGKRLLANQSGAFNVSPFNIQSADSRYIILNYNNSRDALQVYDVAKQKTARFIPQVFKPLPIVMPQSIADAVIQEFEKPEWTCGKLLSNNETLLVVTDGPRAFLAEKGQSVKVCTAKRGWRWSGDNTVWELDADKVRVLQWRDGSGVVREISLPPRQFAHSAVHAAVFGNGELIARVETLSRTEHGSHRHFTVTPSRQYLSLFRGAKCLGRYQVKDPGIPLGKENEYLQGNKFSLGFAPNGQYLAWRLSNALYVFRVPGA